VTAQAPARRRPSAAGWAGVENSPGAPGALTTSAGPWARW